MSKALFTECSIYILEFRSNSAHECNIFLCFLITGHLICQGEEGESSFPLTSHHFLFQCFNQNQNSSLVTSWLFSQLSTSESYSNSSKNRKTKLPLDRNKECSPFGKVESNIAGSFTSKRCHCVLVRASEWKKETGTTHKDVDLTSG